MQLLDCVRPRLSGCVISTLLPLVAKSTAVFLVGGSALDDCGALVTADVASCRAEMAARGRGSGAFGGKGLGNALRSDGAAFRRLTGIRSRLHRRTRDKDREAAGVVAVFGGPST
jgi:hypothetical protein